MSRPDYDPSQEEITKLRLLLNQAESQRDAFKAAMHSEVKDIMRRAVSQATYDARYDAEASLKENDEAENTIAQLKAKLENRDREVAALKAEADRFKAEVERLRKAGDAMVQLLDQMDVVMDMNSDHPEVDAWKAAKDGKQS